MKRKETFTVQLKNGPKVKVTWTKNCWGTDTLDHVEFRGPVTNSGYLSDFLPHDKDIPLKREQVMEYAQQLAQKSWTENKERYGKQLTLLGGDE